MTTNPRMSSPNAYGDEKSQGFSRRNFLKLSGLSALSVAGSTFLAACGPAAESDDAAASTDADATADTGVLGDGQTLRVGMEAAYAPYNWQTSEESEYTIPIDGMDGAYADGYDVQFAKVVAEALDMTPVAVKMSFSGLIDSLNNGNIDIIMAGMSATDERKEAIDFSDPYFEGAFGLLVRSDSAYASATSLDDFKGAAVLGQKDTLLDDIIDEIPEVNHLTPVDSVPSQLSQVNQGTCDAITFNVENVDGFLRANPDLTAILFEEGKGFSITVPANAGIKKGQDTVLAKINEAIAAVSEDERTQIFNACVDRQPV